MRYLNKLSKSSFQADWLRIVEDTCLLATRQSSLRWHDSYSGFYPELGKSLLNVKLKAQVENSYEAQ